MNKDQIIVATAIESAMLDYAEDNQMRYAVFKLAHDLANQFSSEPGFDRETFLIMCGCDR